MNDLSRFRAAIDEIDGQVLGLLNERAKIAREIGRIKERDGRPVYVPERAEHLISRLVSQSTGPLGEQAIRAIYTEIMSAAIALEKEMVVACAGEAGGDAHFAARQQFGSSIRFEFLPDAAQVVESLISGRADCGVVSGRDFSGLASPGKEEMEIVATIDVDHGSETSFLVLGYPRKHS